MALCVDLTLQGAVDLSEDRLHDDKVNASVYSGNQMQFS